MRYSIEPRDKIYLKGYGFLSFAKNMGKSVSNKYGQKRLDSAKQSSTDIDNAQDVDIVMPMYNLIEDSDNYSETSGSLWQYY